MNFNLIPKHSSNRDTRGMLLPLFIPLVPEDEIISFVEKMLGKIPRIEWVRKNASFIITSYRIEGWFINETSESYQAKRMAIFDATDKALAMFPHNKPNYEEMYYDYDYSNLPMPTVRGGYCQIEISLHYDDEKECYVLDRKRLRGDRFSVSYLFGTFGYEMKANILWMTRNPYLSLAEGVQLKAGKEDHISKYLFNELICKEVCSYMSEGVSTYTPVQSSFLI